MCLAKYIRLLIVRLLLKFQRGRDCSSLTSRKARGLLFNLLLSKTIFEPRVFIGACFSANISTVLEWTMDGEEEFLLPFERSLYENILASISTCSLCQGWFCKLTVFRAVDDCRIIEIKAGILWEKEKRKKTRESWTISQKKGEWKRERRRKTNKNVTRFSAVKIIFFYPTESRRNSRGIIHSLILAPRFAI